MRGYNGRLLSELVDMTMDLATARAELFEPLKGDSFSVKEQDLSLQLIEVTQLSGPKNRSNRDPFSLTFRGAWNGMPAQGLYRLEHPSAGELEIFLVPVGMDKQDYLFEAVFN